MTFPVAFKIPVSFSVRLPGDNHGNQVISLTVLHTIWTREHNRIARALAALNPGWDEDTVFMEARRILLAEFQHIIYNEWLPLLLGICININSLNLKKIS